MTKKPAAALSGAAIALCYALLQGQTLLAQQTATDGGPYPSSAPLMSPAPTDSSLASPNSFILGQWKVERAIFESSGTMKEVTGIDEKFLTEIVFSAAGKGTAHYATKPGNAEMEWDLKDGQNLTLAFGTRLRPLLDLYKFLLLGDGTIFLRSTRLANATGTVTYVLRKMN